MSVIRRRNIGGMKDTSGKGLSGSARQTIKASKPRVSYDILEHKKMWLLPANEKYPPIEVTDSNDFTIWGVVTYIIKKACTRL